MLESRNWEAAQKVILPVTFEFLHPPSVNQVPEELKKLDFAAELQTSYELIQRLAVVIEAVTLDQAVYNDVNPSDLLKNYRKIEWRIVAILRELRISMAICGVKPAANITWEIMPEKIRNIPSYGGRNDRDAVVVQQYLIAMQYLRAVFDHFRKRLEHV